MKAKAILILGTAVIVSLSAVGGTMALFTASTPNSNNTFTTGTLSLNSWRDQGDTIPGPMFYTTLAEGRNSVGDPDPIYPTGPWAPGDSQHRVLIVKNTGSLDAWLVSVHTAMQAGSSRALADKLQVKITTDAAGANVIASGTMGQFLDHDQNFVPKLSLPAGPPFIKALHFWVSLPLDADNSYQNTTLRVDFTINAEQKKNNP